MKKALVLWWAGMVLLLSGCGAAATMVNLKSTASPASALSYEVEMDTYEESIRAEDGTVLGQVSFQVPRMEVRRGDDAVTLGGTASEQRMLETAAEFNRQFESWLDGSMARELETWARSDYAVSPEFFSQYGGLYEERLVCKVYRTEKFLSVAGQYYTDTGGNHPNSWNFGWNYDLEQGTFLEPAALAEDPEAFRQAVAEEILRQARTPGEDGTVPAEGYWEDYADIAADWSSYAVFFREDGMTVVFSPYELACYAAGTQTFLIPAETLRPWLSSHGQALLEMETA